MTSGFGSEAIGSAFPKTTDVMSTSSETPAEPQLFTEDYYRLKRKLFLAIAILEGQVDGK